ncbi:Squalene epoxidase [Podila epigama]|nr:Squalene epoxidase [Podila epigama]
MDAMLAMLAMLALGKRSLGTPHFSLATHPVPKSGSAFDIIVIGGGVVGSAFSATLGKQNKRVLMLERDLGEPDRIVGELLQPGGVDALKELGLADCLEGIDAIPTLGYGVICGDKEVHIPYPTDPKTGKPVQGRAFHHGRFIQKLRAAASQVPSVTIVEATVNDILWDQDNVRATGVTCTLKKDSRLMSNQQACPWATEQAVETTAANGTTTTEFRAPIVVVADGCFSKFRKQFIPKSVKTPSHFVGLIIENTKLPFPHHGHVILATPSPILMYQISETETRVLIDIPGTKLPSASSGALRAYLESSVCPQLPSQVQSDFLKTLQEDAASNGRRIRSMPNSFLPPSTSSELGIVLLGDAMNMRHPLTGGGMTVALNDVVYLKDLLQGDVTKDQELTMVQMELFFWKRKELCTVINVLAQALYTLFSGQDKNLLALRNGCFSYFQMGGECINGPVGLLSGKNKSRSVLAYHFYAVAMHTIWLLFHNASSWSEYPALVFSALSILWTACMVFLPLLWTELHA